MQQLVIAVLVVVMMAAIGLRSTPSDFREVWRTPRTIILSLFVNVVLLPLLAAGLIRWASLPSEVAIGLMICASAPGGATGPLFASAAGGHLATAVTAMVSLSLLSVFTAPPTLSQALGVAVTADSSRLMLPMMGTLVLFQLMPLSLGLGLRGWRPRLAEAAAGPLNKAANALLLLVIVGLLATKGAALQEVGLIGALLSVGLVLINLLLGAIVSPPGPQRRSLSMVAGVRNISLALLISSTWFPAPLTDASILTFGLFTMLIPFGVAQALRRRSPVSD